MSKVEPFMLNGVKFHFKEIELDVDGRKEKCGYNPIC